MWGHDSFIRGKWLMWNSFSREISFHVKLVLTCSPADLRDMTNIYDDVTHSYENTPYSMRTWLIDTWEMTDSHEGPATHCNTLQRTATHCISLQPTATCYNSLQPTATYCNSLQLATTHYTTLQLTAAHCNSLQLTTHCNSLQPTTAQCNWLQFFSFHCNSLQLTATHCN